MDSPADDYERKSWREYVMGHGGWAGSVTPVNVGQKNDPRVGFPLNTVNLTRSPVYIRFEPAGDAPDWTLAFAAALVYDPQFVVAFTPPFGFDNLWLGDSMGKILYLTDAYWDERRPRGVGVQIAEKMGLAVG